MTPVILSPPSIPVTPELTFDPVSESATNSPLDTGNNTVYGLVSHSYPMPPMDLFLATSADMEGETPVGRKWHNRQISITLEIDDVGGLMHNRLSDLQAKLAKIARKGGTLKRTLYSGTVIVFDLLATNTVEETFDIGYYSGIMQVSFVLDAKPFGRSPEVSLGNNIEATNPALVFTETGILGDIPALGRLLIDSDSTGDWWRVDWGVQSENYDASADGALFFQAETFNPLNGAALAVGSTGATGAGSNVIKHAALPHEYFIPILTTTTNAGNRKTHVGEYRVFFRVFTPATNTHDVSTCLEWSVSGASLFTRNDTTTIPVALFAGRWAVVDAGIIKIPKVTKGTQAWEGRLLAQGGRVSDDIEVDAMWLIPTDEGSGTASAVAAIPALPSSYLARDDFESSTVAANLTTQAMPVGGPWAGAGAATDWQVTSTLRGGLSVNVAFRSTGSETVGRVEFPSGMANRVDTAVQLEARINVNVSGQKAGPVARYVDINNHARFNIQWIGGVASFVPEKMIAGALVPVQQVINVGTPPATFIGDFWTIRVHVDTVGRFWMWAWLTGGLPVLRAYGWDSDFAGGGTLATGKAGMFHFCSAIGSQATDFDNFYVEAFTPDAACYANADLEINDDGVLRQSTVSTIWSKPSAYEGDYLLVPPSGPEGGTARVIVVPYRNPLELTQTTAVEHLNATLFVTPRWLVVPE